MVEANFRQMRQAAGFRGERDAYSPSAPLVFYGNGCRFVEVRWHRMTFHASGPGKTPPDLGQDLALSNHLVFRFVYCLEKSVMRDEQRNYLLEHDYDDLLEMRLDNQYGPLKLPVHHPDLEVFERIKWEGAHIGVLACEFLDEEE